MQLTADDIRSRRIAYHQRLRERHLAEGYSYDDDGIFQTRPYWPLEPKNLVRPHLWKWREVRALVREAGDLIGLGRGSSSYDRRVLALTNPGLGGDMSTTGTLFGDIQLIRPGESAPCHRHTPCAARFILEGSGGFTTVANETMQVAPGDIVFTGQFPWHDHGNRGTDDFVFLDVLDIPLMFFTGTSAWEFDYEPITGSADNVHQPTRVLDFPDDHYTSRLRPRFAPSWTRDPKDFAHLSFRESRASLLRLRGERASPHDGVLLELTSTAGGPIGPTMSIFVQLLRAGEVTLPHRHTSSTLYVVAEGEGAVTIEDQTWQFEKGDIFVVPSWHWHAFSVPAGADADAILHSISDAGLIARMNLWREQRKDEAGVITDSGWRSEVLVP